MEKKNIEEDPVLVINTALQKKNDRNIQYFLNRYKHYDENPEYAKNIGENENLIISHKSTIPDLVIYNKVFNKNECFYEANKKENNYFPRQQYYIRFVKDEKLISKGLKDSKNEGVSEKKEKGNQIENNKNNENNFSDDENDEMEIIKNSKNQNKMKEISYVENNSTTSNNNSMYNEIENLQNNKNDLSNLLNTMKPNFNYFNNSQNYEEGSNSISYNSGVMNNVKSYMEIKTDENSNNPQQSNIYPNYQNKNFYSNNNNKIVNMFSNQIELLESIREKENSNASKEIINKLKEDVIKLVLFGPDGNIIYKKMNFEEMIEYITNNIIEKKKNLEKYDIYIINTEETINGKEFYFPIIDFCG